MKKRIALSAVVAMFAGLLVAAPASAAEVALDKVTVGTISKSIPSGRTGVAAQAKSTISVSDTASANETVDIASAFVSKPASSTATITQTAGSVTGDLTVNGTDFVLDGSLAAGADTGVITLGFTPDVVGTYTLAIWHDRNGSGQVDTGESVKQVSFVVVDGASAVAVTTSVMNATAGTTGSGSLLMVSVKNSAGAAASLGALETLTAAVTGSAVIARVNELTPALASVTLNRDSFDKNGVAYLNVTDATAESVGFTVVGGIGSALTSVATANTLTFVAGDATATSGLMSYSNTSGVATTTAQAANVDGAWTTPDTVATTVNFSNTASAASKKFTYRITDTDGILTGYLGTTDRAYDIVATSDATTSKVAFSITAGLATGESYSVTTLQVAGANGTGDAISVTGAARAATTTTVSPSTTVKAVVGGKLDFTTLTKDQFGVAMPNITIVVSVAGRNASVANTNLVTDANGAAAFSLTDAPAAGVTATLDTITFNVAAGSDPTVNITWSSTLGVSTVTLAYTGKDDAIPGTTYTNIDAGSGGATGTTSAVTATVKDANGVVLAGVPVSFAVSGLTGAEVLTSESTVYTSALGVATANVASYKAGAATVTVTAGGVSSTATIYFKQGDLTDARTVTATVAGKTVTAKVTDRYGNPIEGVTLNATRTGDGYFGVGTSSVAAVTNKDGIAEFIVTPGTTATVVTVAFTTATYGQTADKAGYVGTTAVTAPAAGTSSTNQKGLGNALAPAGVNSATATVAAAAPSAVETANTTAIQTLQTNVAALQTTMASLVASITASIKALNSAIAKIAKKLKIKL